MLRIFFLFLLASFYSEAQVGYEIFLGDYEETSTGIEIQNLENVSQNKGYDNQPYFIYEKGLMLFTSDRGENEQSDIYAYDVNSGSITQMSNSSKASEFSPQRIPGTSRISTIRIDPDTVQRFWSYNLNNWQQDPNLLSDLEGMGYSAWVSSEYVFLFLIVETMDSVEFQLVLLNREKDKSTLVDQGIGRCIQGLPSMKACFYTKGNDSGGYDLHKASLDSKNKAKREGLVTEMPEGVQDFALVDSHKIWAGKGDDIMQFDLAEPGKGWIKIENIGKFGIKGFNRLAINQNWKKIALVVPED